MIKPELIQFFIEIAKTNSIHLAAEKLYVTQPAVSRGIRALEDEIGLTLFERKYDGTYLTKDGESLLPYAQAMLSSLNQFQEQANILKYAKSASLPIHTNIKLFVSSIVLDRYIPCLTEYLNTYDPHLHLEVIEYSSKSRYTSDTVSEHLLTQENSLGIYLVPSFAEELFKQDELTSDILSIAKMSVMSSLDSKYISAGTEKLLPKDLVQIPFINFSDPFLSHSIYEYIMKDLSYEQQIIEESNLNLLLQYIRRDAGVALACNIFDHIAPLFETNKMVSYKESFKYTPLVTPIYYKLILVYNQAILTPAMQELITIIKSMWR